MIQVDRRRSFATWALVFLLSLSVRVVLLEVLPREPNHDELGYVRLAEQVAAHGPADAFETETHVSPLFPVLHSILVRAGLGGIPAGFLLAVVVGSLAPVGVGLLFRRALGPVPGLVAWLAVALHPFTVSFSRWIQPELLTAVLLMGFALLWERGRLALAGTLLGLGYLARPELITLLPLWIAFELLRRKHKHRRVLVALGCCLLVALPWLIHLYVETGRFCISGKDRWVYLNGIAQVETGNGPVQASDLERLDREVPDVLSHIVGAPVDFVRGYVIRWGYLLRNLAGLIPWPALPLVLLGFGAACVRRPRALPWLSVPLFLLPVLPVGMTHQRHLVTLLPILVGFGGVGVVSLAEWLWTRGRCRDAARRRTIWMAVTTVVLSVTVGLVLCEVGLRLAGRWASPIGLDYGDVRRTDELGDGGYLLEGFDADVADGYGGTVRWTNNSTGFRYDREISQTSDPGTLRILSLGDSFAAGYRVGQDDTFSALIEQHLREKVGPAEVLVALVDDPANGLFYLDRSGRHFDPHVVLLGLTLGNDIAQNYVATDPRGRYRLENGSIERRAEEPSLGFRHGLEGQYIGERFRERQPLAARIALSVERTRLARLVREPTWPIESWYRDGGPPRLLDPTHGLGFFLAEPPVIVEQAFARLERTLAAYAEFCRQHDIELIVALFPQRFQLNDEEWRRTVVRYRLRDSAFDLDAPNRRIAEFCRSADLRCIDPTAAMRRHVVETGASLYLPRGDMHWNRDGHKAFFRAAVGPIVDTARRLERSGGLDDLQ